MNLTAGEHRGKYYLLRYFKGKKGGAVCNLEFGEGGRREKVTVQRGGGARQTKLFLG